MDSLQLLASSRTQVYASGFQGVASVDGPEDLQEDLKPLLDTILEETWRPARLPMTSDDFDHIWPGRVKGAKPKWLGGRKSELMSATPIN